MQINDIFTYWEKTSVNNVIIFPLIGHLKKETSQNELTCYYK